MKLMDSFQRRIDYVRLSLTDKCNFQCFYCRPRQAENVFLPSQDYLHKEDIEKLFLVFGKLGVKKVKLTGGEPLLRKDICEIIQGLSRIPFLTDISMTTNGFFLEKMAQDLKKSGLDRINISLDSLREDTFHQVTQTPSFSKVWRGILEALKAGFKQIKLNVVLMRGMNDDEICDFVELTTKYPLTVRFIEFMPTQRTLNDQKQYYLSNKEAESKIRERFALIADLGETLTGPSRYYRVNPGNGRIGFISPLSHNFCDKCNRVRITAKGKLRLCLFGDQEVELLPLIRLHAMEKVEELILKSIIKKPLRHQLENGGATHVESFVSIGG